MNIFGGKKRIAEQNVIGALALAGYNDIKVVSIKGKRAVVVDSKGRIFTVDGRFQDWKDVQNGCVGEGGDRVPTFIFQVHDDSYCGPQSVNLNEETLTGFQFKRKRNEDESGIGIEIEFENSYRDFFSLKVIMEEEYNNRLLAHKIGLHVNKNGRQQDKGLSIDELNVIKAYVLSLGKEELIDKETVFKELVDKIGKEYFEDINKLQVSDGRGNNILVEKGELKVYSTETEGGIIQKKDGVITIENDIAQIEFDEGGKYKNASIKDYNAAHSRGMFIGGNLNLTPFTSQVDGMITKVNAFEGYLQESGLIKKPEVSASEMLEPEYAPATIEQSTATVSEPESD